MEKVIGWKKMVFKEKMTMSDRQKVMNASKKFNADGDEFELCFNLFPIVCLSIDDQQMSDQEMINYIKNIDDMEIFAEISQVIADIQTSIAEDFQKKKINTNMSSKSEAKPEK